ncbi:MAG TPA: acyl carrier protein [Polyangiaceae bacterium]|nr:acyl carrier protein [Polyangiaceae bacterium]
MAAEPERDDPAAPTPELEREFLALVARHVPAGLEISTESTVAGDLGLDSLTIMELFAEVEERFGVAIADDRLMELRTVGDVLRLIAAELRARGGAPR